MIGKLVVRSLAVLGFVVIGLAISYAGRMTIYHLIALACYPACVPALLILGDNLFGRK